MRQLFNTETFRTATTGILGMSATGGGVYVSVLSQVEAWLRIISLLVGITVGLASLISIARKWQCRLPNNENRK